MQHSQATFPITSPSMDPSCQKIPFWCSSATSSNPGMAGRKKLAPTSGLEPRTHCDWSEQNIHHSIILGPIECPNFQKSRYTYVPMLRTTSEKFNHLRLFISSCATGNLSWLVHSNRLSDSFRGRSPLATEADWIRPLADMRPGAQSGFPNAVSSEFNRHIFVSAHAQKSLFPETGKPSSTRARTGDLSRVKRTW